MIGKYVFQNDYVERVYAGLLGKIIGVRHGSPIEMWDYEKIMKVYGEITGYLVDCSKYAADDDINGTVFFPRALLDVIEGADITEQDFGLACLNYVPYEHGFFWWGGYGKSSEHTAYLNMKNGIMPPQSGSVGQNGPVMVEQVGGSIFIDAFGLISPGNPRLAADLARKADSFFCDGNGIYGGMFIAACISAAFSEKDIKRIIEYGLQTIPNDSDYYKVIRKVEEFWRANPEDWRSCYKYIRNNFWDDVYPGNCHIIPNNAIIVLSLLYGEGDFSRTINICNMCGWDTDCNVGNAGTIMGVRNGLQGIDYVKWIKPVNDFQACSSVVGSMNIMDVADCAIHIAKLGYSINGVAAPVFEEAFRHMASTCHFELPGSTHGFTIYSDVKNMHCSLENTQEASHSGKRSLKVIVNSIGEAADLYISKKTYCRPGDFMDSRYDPAFSPILYPGQTVKGSVMLPANVCGKAFACLYAKEGNSGTYIESEKIELKAGIWEELSFEIPYLSGACLVEAGMKLTVSPGSRNGFYAYLDDFDFFGQPNYTIDFAKERMEVWHKLHREVSQFTYLKGLWEIEKGELSGNCCDFGETYTGHYEWTDYKFSATILPVSGGYHNINFRVQGGIRSYALGLSPDNRMTLYKNDNGYTVLEEIAFPWICGEEYRVDVVLSGSMIMCMQNGKVLIDYTDLEKPYLKGQVGVSIFKGSHCHYKDFYIG